MQRAKHAERKRRTRKLILIGAAAERAGAGDLDPDEIAAVLAHYLKSGGETGLREAISEHRTHSAPRGADGDSAHPDVPPGMSAAKDAS